MFNEQRANEPINFIQMLKLTDDFYGQPFLLQEWQKEVLSNVYGTVKDTGYRQYKRAYLEIPKKNGKSTLISALAVYHLTCDSEEGQIFCCASDRGQATIIYKAAVSMIEQNKTLSKLFKITDSRKEIMNIKTKTVLKVLSAEAYTKHGLNPTVIIFDELHSQPNRDLYDTMTFGAGAARKEPLLWVITTAGDDPDRASIGWEVHEYAQKVQDGEIEDATQYAKIYGVKETDDIWDEATWYKVNPSLGITIPIETIREEAITAKNNPANEKLFRWLRLNQWVSLKQIGWLDLSLWDSTIGKWAKDELLNKQCYIGLDLASTTDLTGIALLFPPQQGLSDWRFITEGWIPDENMKERIYRDHVPYDKWVKEGYLHCTPGNATDYDFIRARIEHFNKLYNVKMLCTDPWNSAMLTQQLEKTGMQIIDVTQNMANMSPGMKELEILLKTGKMTHEDNKLARWCFGNVNIAVDGNENIKPMKNKSRDRIDVIVALINAMAIAVRFEKDKCPYNAERGIILL